MSRPATIATNQEKGETFSIHFNFNYSDKKNTRIFAAAAFFPSPSSSNTEKKTYSTLSWFGIKDRIINSLLIAREMLLMSGEGGEEKERGKKLSFLK